MADFRNDVNILLNSNIKNRYWFANKKLYKLCEDNPDTRDLFDDDAFVAKLWMIGRSYAAAVERRDIVNIKNLGYEDDFMEYNYDFYYDEILPAIKNNADYYNALESLEDVNEINDESIPKILKAHKVLMDILNISGKDKRSLASKYLHFHYPKLFFIYDFRASTEISNYVNKIRFKNNNIDDECDKEYKRFYLKCYEIFKNNKQLCVDNNIDSIEKYFTRLLDTVLLVNAAKNAEKKRRDILNKLIQGKYDHKIVKNKKPKVEAGIEVYKSIELRAELVEYIDNSGSIEIKEAIEKRWHIKI